MQQQVGDRQDKITHDRTGKLQDLAVEYFQRAYGLGDRPREDHNELCEEAVEVTQCSRRAFRELIYGHSYQAILGPLREMVPGYKPKLPKREQREQQMAELEQLSLSGGTPPREDLTPRPFKLSSAAQPFESPKLLPQPQVAPRFTTMTTAGPVLSPQSSMVKPKLADRVLASPERHSKSAGASPEPMDLSSYRPGEFSQPEWGSPVMWPTPGETRPQRETPTKPRSASRAVDDDAKAAKVAEERLREEKEKASNEERIRVREEDRVKKEQAEEKERSKVSQDDARETKRGSESNEKEELGVIEEALRDKSRPRQDKAAKPRTPRPIRSPQLAPALFTSIAQPPSPVASVTPGESSLLTVNLGRIGVAGIALCVTLAFCLLRQYVFHLANYGGRMPLASLLPLLFGSYALLAVLLLKVMNSATKTQQLPMAIAADTEDYVEAWELLHVGGDSRELVHALQQVQLLLESLVHGLDVSRSEQTGVNHSIRLLDYLSSIHKKLAEEIGNTVLVMRLVDSLRRMRMSLLKLCLSSEPALPVLEPVSAIVVGLNMVCLLVAVESGSLLFELLLLPSFVYVFALFQLLLSYLDMPFCSVAPLNLSALLYIQKRVRNRIAELQAPAAE